MRCACVSRLSVFALSLVPLLLLAESPPAIKVVSNFSDEDQRRLALKSLLAQQIRTHPEVAAYLSSAAGQLQGRPELLNGSGDQASSDFVVDWSRKAKESTHDYLTGHGDAETAKKAANFLVGATATALVPELKGADLLTGAAVKGATGLGVNYLAGQLAQPFADNDKATFEGLIKNAKDQAYPLADFLVDRLAGNQTALAQVLSDDIGKMVGLRVDANLNEVKNHPEFFGSIEQKRLDEVMGTVETAKAEGGLSAEKAEKLLKETMAPLWAKAAEQRQLLKQLQSAQAAERKAAQAEVERQKNEAIARQDFEQLTQGTRSGVFLISKVATLFGDQRVGDQISTVGNGAVDLLQAYHGFNESLSRATNLGSTLAEGISSVIFAGNIVSIGLKIFGSLFGGGAPPDQLAIIRGEVENLRRDVGQLQRDSKAQFDLINQNINQSFARLDARFDELKEILGAQNKHVIDLERLVSELRLGLSLLDERLATYFEAQGHREFANSVSPCLDFKRHFPGKTLPFEEFRGCLTRAKIYSADFSSDALATLGPDLGNFENRDLLNDLRDRPERSLAFMARYADWLLRDRYPDQERSAVGLARFARLPNPVEWALGAQSFMTLARQWPEHYRSASPEMFNAIVGQGYLLRAFVREISAIDGSSQQPRQALFEKLLQRYQEVSDAFFREFAAFKENLRVENQAKHYDIFKDTVEKSDFDPFGGGGLGPCIGTGGDLKQAISYVFDKGAKDKWTTVQTQGPVGPLQVAGAPPELARKGFSPALLALADLHKLNLRACIERAFWIPSGDPTEAFYFRDKDSFDPDRSPPRSFDLPNATDAATQRVVWERTHHGKIGVRVRLEVSVENAGFQPYALLLFRSRDALDYLVDQDPLNMTVVSIPVRGGGSLSIFASQEEARKATAGLCPKGDPKKEGRPPVRCHIMGIAGGRAVVFKGEYVEDHDDLRPFHHPLTQEEVFYRSKAMSLEEGLAKSGAAFEFDTVAPSGEMQKQKAAIDDFATAELTAELRSLRARYQSSLHTSLTAGILAQQLRALDGARLMLTRFMELGLPTTLLEDEAQSLLYTEEGRLPGSSDLSVALETNFDETGPKVSVQKRSERYLEFFKKRFAKADAPAEQSLFVERILQALSYFDQESQHEQDRSPIEEAFAKLRSDVQSAITRVPLR